MEALPKFLGIIAQGIQSNWWGIGCPSHCFSSGLPALVAAYCLGLASGLLLVAFFVLLHWLPPHLLSPPVSTAPVDPSARVRAYVHESAALGILQRRRRGG